MSEKCHHRLGHPLEIVELFIYKLYPCLALYPSKARFPLGVAR